MHATCELDLTDFGDADTFRSLLEKHGLRYDGIRINGHSLEHSWVSVQEENIQLFTQCNPIDGAHIDPRAGDRNPGYASYLKISGEISLARSVLRDVFRDAEYIKGIIQQLMTDDGTVVDVTEE
ncbi:hypothetical protein ACFQJ5_14715 [Halomicroarcula sp. GCM10025324]|uniref:hypothetical protein n=1 Tax=Haloarcula TaxID=2237 RepID=UPI0023E82CBD|nr:hypothetical protein [Halomicroarcula sp. ZS-22-S1]